MTEFGSTSSSITGMDTASGVISTDAYKVSTMIKSINESIIAMNEIQSVASDYISDGYHTFKELYKHRAYLFAAICNMFNDMAWKSLKHSDGTMYDGMFIVGMSSPYGDMTYHVEVEYWDLFQVKTLANAPQFDGHTPDDVLERIMTVVNTRELLNKLRETKTNDVLEEKKVILKYKCDLTALFERCFSLSDGVCYLRISPDIEVTVISNSADNSNRIIAAKIPLMYELIQCATIYMNTLTGKFVEVVLTEPYKSAPGAFTFTESTMNGYYPSVLEKFNTYAIKSPTTSDLKKDEATSDTNTKTETVPGEVLVKGMNVFLGYYKNEEATQSAFTPDGWFHTGDMGVMDKDGYLYLRGRSKCMILGPSGQNIYPEEIECVLNNMHYVVDSLVIEDHGGLTALIYPDFHQAESDGLDKDALIQDLNTSLTVVNKELPNYARIAKIEVMPEDFERTPKRSIKRYLYQR